MTEPKENFREEIQELLSKLRVAQADILQDTGSDFFAEAERKFTGAGAQPSERNKRFLGALEFLKTAGKLADAALFEQLSSHAITLAEMSAEFPEEHESCSRVDYVMFAGLRIGGIPEDRYLEKQSRNAGSAAESAQASLDLIGRLVRLALEVPDDDLKASVLRGLLGGVSYLEMERDGKDEDDSADASDDGSSELFAAADRYSVPRPLISRALSLADKEREQTQTRRRKKRSFGKS